VGWGPAAPLLAAAQAGEPRALALFWQRARALGAAAATLLGLLNPRVLIVAESGVLHLPGCLDILRSEVRDRWAWHGSPEPPVVASSFGRDVLAVAAGTVILAEIYADPLAI
jgi:predicted NBD/HSP70 family sugar kinase